MKWQWLRGFALACCACAGLLVVAACSGDDEGRPRIFGSDVGGGLDLEDGSVAETALLDGKDPETGAEDTGSAELDEDSSNAEALVDMAEVDGAADADLAGPDSSEDTELLGPDASDPDLGDGEIVDPCNDGVLGPGETDLDCGGLCPGCRDGWACLIDADCASGFCDSSLTCAVPQPSCSDGEKNGSETDTDCGGDCPGCPIGGGCELGGDCQSGACLAGDCCQPNACGACAPLPSEVCNGQDDDCDGQTDEAGSAGDPGTGPGAPCPLQAGVCGGSRHACRGAVGWICDAATYEALGPYESDESTCDGLDNDCDGATDEGLTSACGCAPVLAEICNAVDDDCDGQTDDLAAQIELGTEACVACAMFGEPVELLRREKGASFLMGGGQDWVATLGGATWIVLNALGEDGGGRLFRVPFGGEAEALNIGVGSHGRPSVVPGGGRIHVGTALVNGNYYPAHHEIRVYNVDVDGTLHSYEHVDGTSDYPGQPARVAWGDDTLWIAYTNAFGNGRVKRRATSGDYPWYDDTLDADVYSESQLVVRSDGRAYVATPNTYGGCVRVARVEGASHNVGSGPCPRAVLRVGPDDRLQLVTEEGGLIKHRVELDASDELSFGDPTVIAGGRAPNLAFDPQGRAVVIYIHGEQSLRAARPDHAGAWQVRHLWTTSDGAETLEQTGLAVDAAGRLHVAFRSSLRRDDGYLDDQRVATFVVCPNMDPGCNDACGGTQCGPDGCGVPCGDCAALEDGDACNGTLACVAGACLLREGSVPDCDDGDLCTLDACDPASGDCAHSPTAESDCDDGNTNTADACHPLTGGCLNVYKQGMVDVPAGSFYMGCEPGTESLCDVDEFPYHQVDVPAFRIDATEITATDYASFLNIHGSNDCDGYDCAKLDAGEILPIYEDYQTGKWKADGLAHREVMSYVTWYGARAYCQWKGKRLCSEAEWEKAARGGCELYTDQSCPDAMPIWPWGDTPPVLVPDTYGWCGDKAYWAGSYPARASAYGVLDMDANLREWVADCPHDDYLGAPSDGSEWVADCAGGSDAGKRILRGGNYLTCEEHRRCSARVASQPTSASGGNGVRCCESVD